METNDSFDPNQTQWYPVNAGSPLPTPGEAEARRKKWTRIGVASAIALLVVIIVFFFVRSAWEQRSTQKVVRAEKQTQAMGSCDQTKNPEKCKSAVPVDLARKEGDTGYCANLSSQERDTCLNAAALTAKDAAICKQIANVDQAALCQDAVIAFLVREQGESDALCAQYATPSTQDVCVHNYLVALARKGDCSDTRIDEALCKESKYLQQAVEARDPSFCDQIHADEAKAGCRERVGSGDVDGDGLDALAEAQNGSNDHLVDTDGDGLTDLQEIQTYFTNPSKSDTDGDGYPDGIEVAGGYDPRR